MNNRLNADSCVAALLLQRCATAASNSTVRGKAVSRRACVATKRLARGGLPAAVSAYRFRKLDVLIRSAW